MKKCCLLISFFCCLLFSFIGSENLWFLVPCICILCMLSFKRNLIITYIHNRQFFFVNNFLALTTFHSSIKNNFSAILHFTVVIFVSIRAIPSHILVIIQQQRNQKKKINSEAISYNSIFHNFCNHMYNFLFFNDDNPINFFDNSLLLLLMIF